MKKEKELEQLVDIRRGHDNKLAGENVVQAFLLETGRGRSGSSRKKGAWPTLKILHISCDTLFLQPSLSLFLRLESHWAFFTYYPRLASS